MVNLDMFSYLKSKIKRGNSVNLSMSDILNDTKLTKRVVATKLKNLQNDGYIEIIRNKTVNGASLSNTYIIKENPKLTPNVHMELAQKVRSVYCSFVSERIKEKLNPKFSFQGYSNQFISVAEIISTGNLNVHMYISACFHTFNENWCRKTFKVPYPPPYIIASKKNAYERYNGYLRFLNGNTIGEQINKTTEEKLLVDLYTWKQTGSIEDESFIKLLIENDTISPMFAVCLDFVSDEFRSDISLRFKLSDKEVKINGKLLKKLIKEN